VVVSLRGREVSSVSAVTCLSELPRVLEGGGEEKSECTPALWDGHTSWPRLLLLWSSADRVEEKGVCGSAVVWLPVVVTTVERTPAANRSSCGGTGALGSRCLVWRFPA
jgi:hypothetical protein